MSSGPQDAVLLVSDDAEVASSVGAAIAPLAVRFLEAHTTEDAKRLAAAEEIHLILVDMMAKAYDGSELCRVLKADLRTLTTPLLAIVNAAPGAPGASLKVTALDHVVKPIETEALRRKVNLILKAHLPPAAGSSDMLGLPASVDMTKVQARIRRIQELGACPYVVTKVLKVSKDSKTGSRELAVVIGMDHALTAKLLKIANSVMYSTKERITQISQAVTRVGFRGVLDLAMGISVSEAFKKSAGAGGLNRAGFWKHSLAVGLVAQRLALRSGEGGGEEAFVAGLLHDVGKPLLEECFPAEYRHVVELSSGLKMPIRSAERELFGADHGFFGGLLLKSWGLPAHLVAAVSFHHQIDKILHMEDYAQRRLIRLVHLADALCKAAQLGCGGDYLLEEVSSDVLSQFSSVSPGREDIIGEVEKEIDQYHQFLEMPRGESPPPAAPEKGLDGQVVEILTGPGEGLNITALCVERAGGTARLSEIVKQFEARLAAAPPQAVVLDSEDHEKNLRLLEKLDARFADRTVCYVNPAALRAARRGTERPAAVFAKPCDPQEVVMRLAGR